MARATSKAWISATQQIPSTEHLGRMTRLPAADLGGLRAGLAAGDVPRRGRHAAAATTTALVVAGVAASGATVSPFLPAGVAPGGGQRRRRAGQPGGPPHRLRARGAVRRPARRRPGHGGRSASATSSSRPEDSLGMKHSPGGVGRSTSSGWARGISDRVMAAATARGRAGVGGRRRPRGRPDPAGPDGRHGRRRGRRRARHRGDGRAFRRPERRGGADVRRRLGVARAPSTRRRSWPRQGECRSWSTAASSAASASAGSTRRSALTSRARSRPCERRRRAGRGARLRCHRQPLRRPPRRGCRVWRSGPSTRGPSTWRPSRQTACHVVGLEDFVAPVHARTIAGDLPACDFGIVATKALHTREAVAAARGCARRRSSRQRPERAGQRGGHRRPPAARDPRQHRARGGGAPLPGWCATTPRGHLRRARSNRARRRLTRSRRLAGLLSAGGLPTHALADARGPQWTKVVFNAATSPIAALTGLTVGQVCTDPLLRQQVDRLIDEALSRVRRGRGHPGSGPARVGGRGDRDRLRAQAEHAPGRPGTSASPRSTSSTAASRGRAAGSASRRRCTRRWSPSCTASKPPGRSSAPPGATAAQACPNGLGHDFETFPQIVDIGATRS